MINEALTSIKGVGPGREKQFHKLGIYNVSTLLMYFPRSYEDRRKIYGLHELVQGETIGVIGTVVSVKEKKPRPRLSILEVFIGNGQGSLQLTLFNQGYKKNFYKKYQFL